MQVIIPLAGLGTRLRPHTHTRPKPLINVAGKPILGHILDGLKGLAIDEVIFIVGYLGNQIEEYVKGNYDFPARYVEQAERRGQAHAIYLARDYISGPVLIIFVDTIFEVDLSKLSGCTADGIIYTKEVEDPSRFGVVVEEEGYITKLVEKPSEPISNLAIIGVYYLANSGALLECIGELLRSGQTIQGEYFLADALQIMIDRGTKLLAERVEVWEDCGKPETLLATNRYLLDRSGGQMGATQNSVIRPPVYIARTAEVIDSIIGPYTSIAERSVIKGSIIRNSIINEGAVIENANLESSLIGAEAHVNRIPDSLDVGDSSKVKLA